MELEKGSVNVGIVAFMESEKGLWYDVDVVILLLTVEGIPDVVLLKVVGGSDVMLHCVWSFWAGLFAL